MHPGSHGVELNASKLENLTKTSPIVASGDQNTWVVTAIFQMAKTQNLNTKLYLIPKTQLRKVIKASVTAQAILKLSSFMACGSEHGSIQHLLGTHWHL